MPYTIKSALAAAALALAATGQSAPAMAGDGSFKVVNSNGSHSIQAVWIAEAGNPDDPWSSITLSSPVMPYATRDFTTSGNLCFYDVKVEFNDGTVQTFFNVNACRGTKLFGA